MWTDIVKDGETEWSISILLFYCSITNYHKFGSLKQHTSIISQFYTLEIWDGMNGFSAQGLTTLKSRCSSTAFSSEVWGSLSSSFLSLAQSIALQNDLSFFTGEWSPHFLASCWPGVSLSPRVWCVWQVLCSCPLQFSSGEPL